MKQLLLSSVWMFVTVIGTMLIIHQWVDLSFNLDVIEQYMPIHQRPQDCTDHVEYYTYARVFNCEYATTEGTVMLYGLNGEIDRTFVRYPHVRVGDILEMVGRPYRIENVGNFQFPLWRWYWDGGWIESRTRDPGAPALSVCFY